MSDSAENDQVRNDMLRMVVINPLVHIDQRGKIPHEVAAKG